MPEDAAQLDVPKPLRLLIVLPSWVGDAAMATPTLRRIRRELPGTFIGALARPGIDQLLAGSDFIDEYHVERASGVMGPKFVAAKLRPRRYDATILLTNSFSTALIVRIAVDSTAHQTALLISRSLVALGAQLCLGPALKSSCVRAVTSARIARR